MGEVVNLNRARKAKAKAEDARRADANRAAFGRTKVEKLAEAARRLAEDRRLDGNKLDKD